MLCASSAGSQGEPASAWLPRPQGPSCLIASAAICRASCVPYLSSSITLRARISQIGSLRSTSCNPRNARLKASPPSLNLRGTEADRVLHSRIGVPGASDERRHGATDQTADGAQSPALSSLRKHPASCQHHAGQPERPGGPSVPVSVRRARLGRLRRDRLAFDWSPRVAPLPAGLREPRK
jgi:hypothetical protein